MSSGWKIITRIGCLIYGHKYKKNWINLDVGVQAQVDMCYLCGKIK